MVIVGREVLNILHSEWQTAARKVGKEIRILGKEFEEKKAGGSMLKDAQISKY